MQERNQLNVAGRRIVVVGGGGFARETIDVLEDITAHGDETYEIVGFTDPDPEPWGLARMRERGIAHLGDDASFLDRPSAEYFTVAIGDPRVRQRLVSRYRDAGRTPVVLKHPSAHIGRRTHLGEGVIICAGAVISTNVRLGSFVTVNPNSTIGHDSVLDEFVSINPAAVISGEVTLGSRTLVGAGSVVLEGISVGADCTIGASACVTKNVPDGTTVVGIPAKSVILRQHPSGV